MITYKEMNSKEFADFLLTLGDGDTIDFATTCKGFYDPHPTSFDLEDWYFAKVIYIEDYDSRFILIDYCGGEEAYAIPLNNYSNKRDEDDYAIVHSRLEWYFKSGCANLREGDHVWVEFREED